MAADRTGFAPRADDARRGSEALIWCDAALCACDKAAHGRCGAGAGRGVHPGGAHRFAHRSAPRSRRRPSTLVRAARPDRRATHRVHARAHAARDARACGARRARADAHNSPVSAAPRTAGGPAGGPISRSAVRPSRPAHARCAPCTRGARTTRRHARPRRRPPAAVAPRRPARAARWPGYCSMCSVIGNGAGAASQDSFRAVRRRAAPLDNGVPRVRPPRRPGAPDAVLFGRAHSSRMRRTHGMGTRR